MKLLIVTLFLILVSVPQVFAIYDDNFKDCLTKKIYEDCEKNLVWTAESVSFSDGSSVIKRGEPLTMEKIRKIVDFADLQDNDFKMIGYPVENYPERFHCGNYYLRVNDNRYFWKGIEVTCPTNITQEYFRDFTLFGFSIISNGGFTLIGFAIIGIGGLTLLSVGVVITLIYIIKKKKVKITNYTLSVTNERK